MSVAINSNTPRKLQFFMDGDWHDSKSGVYMPVTNSSVGPTAELARISPVQREDRRAICELTGVYFVEALFKVPHALHAEHRTKNLVESDPHLRRDVVE